MKLKTIPILMAFLCMGFGDAVGPLTSQLQAEYQLSNTLAGFVTFMGFIMFGVLSVPLGLFQDRKGKKFVLLLGLLAALLGLVLPIIGNFISFGLLLGSLLLLGTGATMLQVAGNPVMRDVSAEGKYSRNLSFGQFIKAIGSLSGALIPLAAAEYFNKDWKLMFPIYSAIVVITLVFVFITSVKEKKDEESEPATFASCFSLLGQNKFVLFMVIGIFLYVGAEVSMSANLPKYLEHKFNYDIKELGLWGTLFFFLALMTGRFLGSVVLNWISAKKFLIITAIVSIVGVLGLYIASSEVIGFIVIFIIGLSFANIFPLIFSITVDEYPARTNEISGLMVTAIIGGAFVPLIFGAVADLGGLMTGFIVPMLCVTYVFFVSLKNR